MTSRPRIVGISGSLREASYNTALLRTALALVEDHAETQCVPIDTLPYFCDDLVLDPPAAVIELWSQVKGCDALLLVTPEYNGAPPGVLKNALDWLSVPHRSSSLRGCLVALAGASTGMLGTARAQTQLRSVLMLAGADVVAGKEVLVPRAHEAFDADLRLRDEFTLSLLEELMGRTVSAARGIRATADR